MAFVSIIVDRSHCRHGPKFRKKVHDWMIENVGENGKDWHLRFSHLVDYRDGYSYAQYAVHLKPEHAVLFQLRWRQ